MRASKNGKTHLVLASRHAGYLVLACSGRSMTGMMPEENAPLTCKSCVLKSFEADGETCFKLGTVRIVPRAILIDGGVAAAKAWYRGWDRANLAAPVPD